MSNTLIVFAREPARGLVKKRLANDIGDPAALAVYQRLLDRTLRLARRFTRHSSGQPSMQVRLVVCGHKIRGGGRLSQFCANTGAALQEQQGEDLGQRMRNALNRARLEGARRTVLIGADCPELNQSDLQNAFLALNDVDIVISPTYDGGYCLVGTGGDYPEIFEDIAWGTNSVGEQTVQRAQMIGRIVRKLPLQNDIDYLNDWHKWSSRRERAGLAEFDWHSA